MFAGNRMTRAHATELTRIKKCAGTIIILIDISQAAVDKGLAGISKSLDRLLAKEKITAAQKDAALACIQTSTDYAALKPAQLVIEAATENHEIKNKILAQLDALLAPETLLATNTSSI